MSLYSFSTHSAPQLTSRGSIRNSFASWILANHGSKYRATIAQQHGRPLRKRFHKEFENATPAQPTPAARVGIVGGGFAGLFAGLIFQSLGIEFDIFEGSDRVGGRIQTWYSTNHDAQDPNRAGLYGEVGGMRLPQYSADMLPVQQLALAVNAVLERNGMKNKQVFWRKFYYDSPNQRLRYNNMPTATTQEKAVLQSFNFGQSSGGDVPDIWTTPKSCLGGKPYLPINKVLDKVNGPFISAIDQSFSAGFELLMQFDQYSMWDYLTTQFRLGDLEEYYDPAMGPKNALLPWSVANYLETTNVGTGMYSVSFVEMVIAVYDWGGSKNPYHAGDESIYMLTVEQGMQRFPDACCAVLNMREGVTVEDGSTAQKQVGMLPATSEGLYAYDPPNLMPDAKPALSSAAHSVPPAATRAPAAAAPARHRVHLRHKVVTLRHDPKLFDGHGGMVLSGRRLDRAQDEQPFERTYPYVITTLPNGSYLNGDGHSNLLSDLSFEKAQALRESNYMPAFKAFLTFKRQFWTQFGEQPRQAGYGAAATDRPNRQIIYPSYGYDADGGVLQVYCWAADARKLGALSDRERIDECLKGIQYLYPEIDISEYFAGYDDGRTTKTWFWDTHTGGGAFALFSPGQFKQLYPALLTPEFDGCLNFAGECCSVHHGWIVGALDSAYNAALNILKHAGATEKIKEMQATWGCYTAPDISSSAVSNVMDYAFEYNVVDRKAAAVATPGSHSIYGNADYVFKGQMPAMVEDYASAPQSMMSTTTDQRVKAMLNATWNDNVALRQQKPPKPVRMDSAVHMLEDIYYGNNFQCIPAPGFWLKDDDEFARQQLGGFMPTLLRKVNPSDVAYIADTAKLPSQATSTLLAKVQYVADYRSYLSACTVTPKSYYLPKPIVFFSVADGNTLMPVGIQLEKNGELFTPDMPNAENAWLLAKILTNCAGQTLHDVVFHQLLTHQICAMVSIALFSEEVFNPDTLPHSPEKFQQHPVFKLLRPHVVKALEFQQTVYNRDYDPHAKAFPQTRTPNGAPGVYNIGSIYDEIFSCGRIGNYQLQDRVYGDPGFNFLDLAISRDAARRGVRDTPFSYPYVHDASLWYDAIERFVGGFVDTQYPAGDSAIAADVQLQRFFAKLIPAFNHSNTDQHANRFPHKVKTAACLKEVLTMFIWQFSVQHTVVNDGAYNHAAFVPNAPTLAYAPPAGKSSAQWTAADVLACLPSRTETYAGIGNMTFMDVQINASVTGQGPYPQTVTGRMVLEPSIDVLQDTYGFSSLSLRELVTAFFQDVNQVEQAIRARQARDIAQYVARHPGCKAVPETVRFDLITPGQVMNSVQT